MRMPTSREREVVPARRKSCEACRAAKRRCDLALPTCYRCTQRNLTCAYPGWPSPDLIPAMLSIINGSNDVSEMTVHPPSLVTDSALDLRGHSGMNVLFPPPVCEQRLDLAPFQSRSLNELSAAIQSRLQYPIDLLKDVPRMMVMENQTPWCHPHLYGMGMPKVIQDVYSSCALYIAKTPINTPVMATLLDSRLRELLRSYQELIQQPTMSPQDILAHCHALILYQIMRLFDPSLHTHPAVFDQAIIEALQYTATSLFASTQFPLARAPDDNQQIQQVQSAFPSPTTLDSIMQFWSVWVFEESARRTILLSFFIIQLFKLLRGDRDMKCDGRLGLIHSWYLSGHLWNAPTAFDFAVAWFEKEKLVVYNVNIVAAMQEAQPSDFDSFGKIMLVSVIGIDQAAAWFGEKGALI